MRTLDLREYRTEEVRLSADELQALQAHQSQLALTIEPADEGAWRLTPGSTVGALEIGDILSVSIRPKLDIARLLFLASYALGGFKLADLDSFDFPEEHHPVEATAFLFADAARRAFVRGLLHGYRTEEEALLTVRGRIRFDEQIRKRFGVALPAEVRYDDFTEDIPENQLVRAATHALGAMRLRDPKSRSLLGRVAATLANVSLVHFQPQSVPQITLNRLNGHYRQVIGLSRLILRHATVETGRGRVRAPGFLMDMNRVFEGFIRRALREKLHLTEREFPANKRRPFDKNNKIGIKPDLSWRKAGTCVFAGDAKYKRIKYQHAPNADVYQLLAYSTALDLPGGILIYAEGERDPAMYEVRNAGKQLEVFALDLGGEPADLLEQISKL
ncbi:MAG: hypothetical protein OXC19_21580, partial [Bryobacterales bacterium]|nr:hypothetical protein [Bryobacterales bacterium]